MRYLIITLFIVFSCSSKNDQTSKIESEPILDAFEEEFWDVISKESTLDTLTVGYDWSEGPVWVEGINSLLFSDVPRNTIYKWSEVNGASVYLTPSGYTEEKFYSSESGSNGLMINQKGKLVLCQHGNRAVSIMEAPIDSPMAIFAPIASTFEGNKFNSPNDITQSENGTYYFTDPPYGLPNREKDSTRQINYFGVYKVDTLSNVSLMVDSLTRPNGIALNPDESKAYVANSDPNKAIWAVYDINENGDFENGKLFFDATAMAKEEQGLPDGLKVNADGNIFATGPGGVFVFSSQGKLLGKIRTGQATANCALGFDETTLYITANSYIFRLKFR